MTPWLRSENAKIAAGVAIVMAVAVFYVLVGGPDPVVLVVWLVWIVLSAIFLRIAAMFAFDLVQYAREGWNLEARKPRADFRIGSVSGRPMAPRTILWLAYPLFLLAFGAAAVILGLQVFGYLHIFY